MMVAGNSAGDSSGRPTGGAAKAARLEPTLPGAYYTDPSILAREWERIFQRSWLYAGREEQVARPGDFVTLPVGNESVLIVRGDDGRLRAFYNVCRHRGSILCAGETGSLKAIRCPYHAWTYGLDGGLKAAPNLRREEGFPKEEFSLHPVALEVWRGGLFVNLEAGAVPPLATALLGMPGRVGRYPLETLRVARHDVHDVEANWKILIENYQECYHCPGVHPELCALVPLYGTGAVDNPGNGEVATFRAGAVTFTHTGTTRRPLFPGLTEQERRTFNGELILPNTWMNFLPDFVQTRTLWPLSPTRTRFVTDWLFDPETMARDDFDPQDAIAFTNLIAEQDWKVCEGVQRGVGSRAHRHGVFTPLEEELGHFKRWVVERLEGP
ncbi:MAG TPA: aromatic ring-hydroxylating dioxygenase subunit alpha [Candidatus Polarisedimenticolia bacterium]|nr:aromatic ring-hydroxylating dioxygenase subunit alpha [Candidatus Polarisedimenticolia bacterium]